MHAMRRWTVGGVVAMSSVLVGCGGPEDPGPSPTPSVVWSSGEPSGPLEGDPWVQAVRGAGGVAKGGGDQWVGHAIDLVAWDLDA